MKIPDDVDVYIVHIESVWSQAAIRLSMEFGVYIEVDIQRRDVYGDGRIDSIGFKAMGHYFEGEKDLRTALNNKAFL
jgi:hypothetical protein